MFGKHWRDTDSTQLQAVLILGIPTDRLPDDDAETFVIPEAFLVKGDRGKNGKTSLVGDDSSQLATIGTPYYSSAHIYKVYLVQRTTTADHCSAIDEKQDLQELFAKVDANGDGKVTKEEATEYLRKERQVNLDAHSIDVIWQALDADGNGSLDISEFPRFLEVVNKEIERMAAVLVSAPRLDGRAASPLAVVQAAERAASQAESVGVAKEEARLFRAAVGRLLAAIPGAAAEKQEQAQRQLKEELTQLGLKDLRTRAAEAGVNDDEIELARDSEQPKQDIIALIVKSLPAAHQDANVRPTRMSLPTEADIREELSGLKLKELKTRAKKLGIDEVEIDEIDDADDPKAAAVEIVLIATRAEPV
jgi:hypothetical protein